MKTIEFALQDKAGNVISTYGTLAELREGLLAVNGIDEVSSDEQAYAKTDAIVRDYVGFLDIEKLVDGEPSGTYNHVSDSDEGAITDDEHDAMYDMFEELAQKIEKLVIKNRAHMIYKTLPSHLEVVSLDGYDIAIIGFLSADELQDYVNEHDHMLTGALYDDETIIDATNSNYEYRRGIDMLKTWSERDDIEVYEPMSREDFLSDIVEAQYSGDEEDNERIASYYAEALDKIGQVGDDEILTIYQDGEANVEQRYVDAYEYYGHTIRLCAYASSLDF